MWTRSRPSTASHVDGSNVWHASQSVANSTKVTRPTAGSTYPPVSLVASTEVKKRSASTLRLKFLLLLAPSGVRQRARQPSRTRSTDAISAPHGWPRVPGFVTGMRGRWDSRNRGEGLSTPPAVEGCRAKITSEQHAVG